MPKLLFGLFTYCFVVMACGCVDFVWVVTIVRCFGCLLVGWLVWVVVVLLLILVVASL